MNDTFDDLRLAYLTQPREVSIETLALCNARCTFCPYPTLVRQGTRMSDETIERFIAEMAGFTRPFFVSPFKVNEPLLDLRLEGICVSIMARCPAAVLRLFTNGSPLTPRHMSWIANLPRVEHLWVSLNSVEPDDYERLMGIPLQNTVKRLDALHVFVDTGAFTHPVVLSRVSGEDPLADLYFLRECAKRWPLFDSKLLKRDAWLGYVSPSDPRIPQTPCGRWFELSVMATGKVALCCMSADEEFCIGDAGRDGLLAVYNQPHLIERRRSALDRRGIIPCEKCSY